MKKVILSLAAVALAGTATPALAKNGHGRGLGAEHGRGHARGDFNHDRRDVFGANRFGGRTGFCPPGLARKNNGCLPPGQERRLGIGDRLPAWLAGYNVPRRYSDRYRDDADNLYRYDQDQIYRVDRRSGLIDDVISILGL